MVRIEIEPRQDVAGPVAFGQLADAGAEPRGDRAHLVVAIDVRADLDRLVVDHLHQQDLVMMAVVGGHAGEPAGLGLGVPLGEVIGRVFHLRGEQLVGVELRLSSSSRSDAGCGELEHDRQQAGRVYLGVGVPVVDLHAVEARHRVVGAFLDVREEDQAAVGPGRLDQGRVGSFI